MDDDEAPGTLGDIEMCEALAEGAYKRMYESRHPKDERDDALLQLSSAMRIAERLGLKERRSELQKRYDHIEAVYNSQFRR